MANFTEFFSKIDAKTRIIILVAAVGVIVGVIVIGSKYFGSGGPGSGAANVGNAPGGLQSVPGSKLTPEYYRAVQQANALAAKKAQMTGGSSVPTLINTAADSTFSTGSAGNCTTQCPSADGLGDLVEDINNLVRMGSLPQEDADRLLDLAKNNVSLNEFADSLEDFLKKGKITPEQARRLLDEYKIQVIKIRLKESAMFMDDLIKNGKLPLEVAIQLLALQKQDVTPEQYAAELASLVKKDKITPETAALLLAQYTKQKAEAAAKEDGYLTRQMAKNGEITAEVAAHLADLQKQNISVSDYEAELNRLVASGKMTPAAAAKLLAAYRLQRLGQGPANSINELAKAAETAFNADLDNLVKSGKISAETGKLLADLAKKDVSVEDYAAQLAKLVKEGKISPEDAKRLLANYTKLHGLRSEAKKLSDLQANNASVGAYAAELKKAVAEGRMSSEEANRLLQEYKALAINPGTTPGAENVDISVPGGADLMKLQESLATQTKEITAGPINNSQFDAARSAAAAEAERQHKAKIQELMTKMSGQAQQLITTWQAPPMVHKQGSSEELTKPTKGSSAGGMGSGGGAAGAGGVEGGGSPTLPSTAPLIKGGSILFAVLDTAVDSDYPDSPVMATIVEGIFKGSKVIGRIAMGKNQDRVTLNFTMMDNDNWPTTKPITAFGVDPDTAHTALASEVNYHYTMRYGSMIASSFMSGYASGIQNAGTTISNLAGSSTTHQALSPTAKLAVGLGQVGTAWSTAISGYLNTPPTVKINSGVALGLLFMADVAADATLAPFLGTGSKGTKESGK